MEAIEKRNHENINAMDSRKGRDIFSNSVPITSIKISEDEDDYWLEPSEIFSKWTIQDNDDF